jgi:ABC-type lipoprotein export system ATPase subunit
MNILGCLDRPTTGRYLLDGLDVSEMTAHSWPQCAASEVASSFSPTTCCAPRPEERHGTAAV